jgi:hypothetical protein
VLLAAAPYRGAAQTISSLASIRVAFTTYTAGDASARRPNVLIMDGAGTTVDTVTTRATIPAKPTGSCPYITYPRYSWSPDGRYLLLERWNGCRITLLLMDRHGNLLRTLLPTMPDSLIPPTWAVDGDVIAYGVQQGGDGSSAIGRIEVRRLDLQGRSTPFFHYSASTFWEDNAPDPSVGLLEQEVGPGEIPTSIQWSIGRQVAVCSDRYAGGLALVNTSSGAVRDRPGWYDPALSADGVLAVSTVPDRGSANAAAPRLSIVPIPGASSGRIALADPQSGALVRVLGRGELPAWSPDGRTLYFERRTAGPSLHFHITMPTLGGDFRT